MRKLVINLDEDTARLSRFYSANRHISDIARFPAFRGSDLDRSALQADGYISHDLGYGAGTLGCARSHIAIWEQAVKFNEPHLILEDDARLARNFDSVFQRLLRFDPDWELITWGYNFNSYVWGELIDGVSRVRIALNQNDLRVHIDNFNKIDCHPTLLRLKHKFGNCGYSVSPNGAAKLLSLCLPLANGIVRFERFDVAVENKDFDCAVNRALPKLNAYFCIPPLVVTPNDKAISSVKRLNTEHDVQQKRNSGL